MILNFNVKGENADKISFLLHKSPNKLHQFSLGFGSAYVFYSKYERNDVSFSLLVDIDPIDLVRGKNKNSQGIFDYVNDRPYATSSFLCSAIAQVFSTALSGRSKEYEHLVKEEMEFKVEVVSLKVKTNLIMLNKIFDPLGYELEIKSHLLDEKIFGEEESNYVDLILKNKLTLQSVLQHLYVLIPVFDNNKHYFVNNDEVEKLLSKGGDWIDVHPEKDFITSRYLNSKFIDAKKLESLFSKEQNKMIEERKKNSLNSQRLSQVTDVIESLNIKSLVDLGCGEGKLIKELLNNTSVEKILGVDISINVLKKAARKLKYDTVKDKIELVQSSAVYYDERFTEYEAICLIEVIEHIDEQKLYLLKENVFNLVKPKYVIITTPNVEYNTVYELDGYRHSDHRFEWSRSEFRLWCEEICNQYNYDVEYFSIGEEMETVGNSTQMGVFKSCV